VPKPIAASDGQPQPVSTNNSTDLPEPEGDAREAPCNFREGELENVRLALSRLSHVRVRNREDAEDIVQETLMTLARKAPKTSLEKNLQAFGIGILRNKVGNYYRKCRRENESQVFPDRSWSSGIKASLTCTPEALLIHKEFRHLAENLLAEFPKTERIALEYYFAGFKTGEIALRMQPERYQNVLNRLHRGKKRLAGKLRKLGYQRASIS
jgi:RNA polymerase sigma factor (sigma-70 family)